MGERMDLKVYCPEKVVTADEALSKIKNGSRIFIGTACGEPQHLIHSMVGSPILQDAVIYQMLSITPVEVCRRSQFFPSLRPEVVLHQRQHA